jgi:hypothetical protein
VFVGLVLNKPRTFDALEEAIVVALRSVTADDAANCIRHAGYAVP